MSFENATPSATTSGNINGNSARPVPTSMNLSKDAGSAGSNSLGDATFALHALACLRAHDHPANETAKVTIPALMMLDDTLRYSMKDLRVLFVLTFGRQTAPLLTKFLEKQDNNTPEEVEARVDSLSRLLVKRAYEK